MKPIYSFSIISTLVCSLASCNNTHTMHNMHNEDKGAIDSTKKECIPCEGNLIYKYKEEEIKEQLAVLGNDWKVNELGHLTKKYIFKDYISSQSFRMSIDEIAEKENHHPTVKYSWGFCEVEIFTFAVNGLTENDFILAAKIEEASK